MKLNVLKKNQLIQEIDLGKDVLSQDYSETIFLIGRSKNCHIILDDKKVSREHARILHNNGKWYVEKTNQENACQVNGEDFVSHKLEVGDVFSVENFSVTVVSEEPNEFFSNAPRHEIQEQIKKEEIKVTVQENNPVVADIQSLDFEASFPEEKELVPEKKEEKKETVEADFNPTSSDDIQFQEQASDDIEAELSKHIELSKIREEDSQIGEVTDVDFSIEEENLPVSEPNNMTYSLENIENDENTKVVQSFASVYLELFGVTAPYDRYIVEKEKTFIGRDPSKCQIVLNDSEVSTVHAVITKNNIMLTLEDLKSSNGTIYKGDRVNKVTLGQNDEFVIGGVTFTVKFRSEFLKEESSTLMAVDENQTVEVEEIVEEQLEEGEQIDALGNMVAPGPVEKSIIKRIWKDDQQRKKLIYSVVVLALIYVFFGEEEKPVSKKLANKKTTTTVKTSPVKTSQKQLTDEQKRSFSALYEIGKEHYNHGRYREALSELQKIAAVDPNFNSNLQPLISFSKEGLIKIEEEEKKRQADIASVERRQKIKELIESAREYTKDRRVDLANTTFNEIAQLDPENLEVTRMKLELEDWIKEKQRKELQEAQKKKEREDKVEKLKPSRTYYLQKEWFKAISKLEDFLQIKNMDDDLTTEASEMLKVSKDELSSAVGPLVGKAKSLLEGQDLKGAYEVYQQILRIEPTNTEALNQMGDIKDQLANRARKVYREAIIAESLSLFQDAKEKFQEVQQISPVDSDYYKKATEKLRDYLE